MILLDTCTMLWLVMQTSKLSTEAKRTLRDQRGRLFISAVNAFEIGQKHATGKLELPFSACEWFERACTKHGLQIVPLQPAHAFCASALPFHHRDPFDRLLIGTAAEEELSILTPDHLIQQYTEVTTIW